MNWNTIHFIENKKAVFCGDKLVLMPLKEDQYDILSQYQLSDDKAAVSDNVQQVVHAFEEYIDNIPDIEPGAKSDNGYVSRIMLCISNDCNLRCKYCYASGGSYGVQRGLMTRETADLFVDFCKRNFKKIDKIIFFGGEPLLNYKLIDYICTRFEVEQFGLYPKFGIITNGTIMTSGVLAVLKKHIKFITVSVDGPESVNDINRVFENGSGSFSKIISFISAIKHNTDIEIHYEATFTEEHVRQGFNYETLTAVLNDVTGISGDVVAESSMKADFLLDYLNGITKDNMLSSNFGNMPSDFWPVFNTIIRRRKEDMCGIGRDSFSVTYDGKIYLCHITNNASKCLVQSIADDVDYTDNPFYHKDFADNEKCRDCWGKNICGSCPVVRFYNADNGDFGREPRIAYCSDALRLLDVLLGIIVTIRTDNELWSNIKKQ